MNNQQRLNYAQSQLKTANEKIQQFSKTLQEKPIHAAAWSGEMFAAAGCIAAWTYIADLLEGDTPLEDVVETLEKFVVHGAGNPPHSSSIYSNLVAQETTKAYTDAYVLFKRQLKLESKAKN